MAKSLVQGKLTFKLSQMQFFLLWVWLTHTLNFLQDYINPEVVVEAENGSTYIWKSFQKVAISAQSLAYKCFFVLSLSMCGVQYGKIKDLYRKVKLALWVALSDTNTSTNRTTSTTVSDISVFYSSLKQGITELKFFWVYHKLSSVEGK